MQPYFFPYIGYFQCIKAVDKYMLYENLDYITEGWMHRNRIMIKNRQPAYINAKVNGKSSNKKIFEIQLDKSMIWKKKLINGIALNYRGSNCFDEIFPVVENLIKNDQDHLYAYNAGIIKGISALLDIDTEIVSSNAEYLQLEQQLCSIDQSDYSLFPGLLLTKPVKKVARVLQICASEKAGTFINAIGGQDLYDKAEFKKYGVDLLFVKTKDVSYKQFNEEFYPHLSIIDVLMHLGKAGTKELLNQYELT